RRAGSKPRLVAAAVVREPEAEWVMRYLRGSGWNRVPGRTAAGCSRAWRAQYRPPRPAAAKRGGRAADRERAAPVKPRSGSVALLARALPARDGLLAHPADDEAVGRHILGDGGAGADGRAAADR